MKRSILAKTITLLSFSVFVLFFVLYHSGYLDGILSNNKALTPSSSNGGVVLSVDSSKQSIDSVSLRNEHYLKIIKQSGKNRVPDSLAKSIQKSSKEQDLKLLSSSKSIQIFSPGQKLFKMDSLLLDSVFKKH